MNISKYLIGLGIAATMAMTACSSEEPMADTPAVDGNESFYATVSLSLPTGALSRDGGATTPSTEPGKDYENKIKTILVILANKDSNGDYQLQSVNQGDASYVSGNSAAPVYTIKFGSVEILSLAEETVYPFIVCNPDATLIGSLTSKAKGDKTFVDEIITLADGNNFSGWLNNNFLMTNAQIDANSGVKMPDAATLKQHNTASNPFNLTIKDGVANPIKVERTVARFDFKATSIDGGAVNVYPIYNNNSSNKQLVGQVTLDGMTLINEASDFYGFRRVSLTADGSNPEIGGLESITNYVVSPDQSLYHFAAFDTNNTAVAPSSFTYSNLSTSTDYSIWRYASENTIAGDPANSQIKGVTTGVVFRGKMSFADGALQTAAQNGDNLYKFGSVVYGNYAALQAEIEANPNTLLAAKAKTAGVYTETAGVYTFVSENALSATSLSANGFTIYRADANGDYNVYYYYWNRHRDNGDPSVMGAMEFGVVRNNVYKLAVTGISEFGHPGNPDDDSDPEDPEDPNESADLYISLDVQVMPWTVRVNNIEF